MLPQNEAFMEIQIRKLNDNEIRERGILSWPVWEKEVSVFDWYYDSTEECLFLEGRVIVRTGAGDVEIKAGDFAVFPKGLKCTWDIRENVRKHYNFS